MHPKLRQILLKPFKFGFIDTTSSGVDGTSFTFSGRSLGQPRSDRVIIVAIAARAATTPAITAVTINGVSATITTQLENLGTIVGIAAARVPEGSTGDIVVSFGATTVARCGIAVYSKLGGKVEAFASGTSSAANPTATLTVPAYGVAVGVAYNAANTTFTTTGLTEDVDSQVGGETSAMVMGSLSSGLAVGSTAFTFTPGTSNTPAGAFAVWENK